MSDHRTVLLYVPAKLPEDLAREFVITHMHGDHGQDAWQHLLIRAAVKENPLTSLIHRLWLEAGGDPERKVGEVTEGEVLTLLHDLKNTAHEAAKRAEEARVVHIKDVNTEPVLVFPDGPTDTVEVKFGYLADVLKHWAPNVATELRKAMRRWSSLKQTGHP